MSASSFGSAVRRKTGKGECIFASWYFVELMDTYAPGDKGLSNV
jgi:hypothetical protein